MKRELEQASIEQLMEAIRAKGQKLYIGIIDSHGMESLLSVENFEKFQSVYGSLTSRARFNGHRSAVVYSVVMSPVMYENYNAKLLKGEFKEVAESIESLSTYKVIG